VKIIKKRGPSKWFLEVQCNGFGHEATGCGSVLELKKKDLVRIPPENGVTMPKAIFFECPVCKRKTNIGYSFWPDTLEGIKWFTHQTEGL
jgi:hypothetical protein